MMALLLATTIVRTARSSEARMGSGVIRTAMVLKFVDFHGRGPQTSCADALGESRQSVSSPPLLTGFLPCRSPRAVIL